MTMFIQDTALQQHTTISTLDIEDDSTSSTSTTIVDSILGDPSEESSPPSKLGNEKSIKWVTESETEI